MFSRLTKWPQAGPAQSFLDLEFGPDDLPAGPGS
jgi:hypothetical protein